MDADDPAKTASACQRNERSDYVINPSRFLGYAQSPLIGRIDAVVLSGHNPRWLCPKIEVP